MSTPLSNLPLKTQKIPESTDNDINDPMVQDVLNEFQEELIVNSQKPINEFKQPQMQQPQMQNIHTQQQMYNIKYNANQNNYNQYLNIDIAKKITIIIILVMVIIYSNIIKIINI
jgi:hypothetical protein